MSSSCVYNDRQILEEKEEGHIIIEPFSEEQLNPCSYNVSVSEHFFREIMPTNSLNNSSKVTYLNPWCEQHVAKRWHLGTAEVATEQNAKLLGLKPGDKYIPLAPFETILVATQEFIGSKLHMTCMIKGRSSIGRSFISVCGGAGWGDVGYVNRWTLMVTNLSRFAHVVLPIGCSIAQIIFLECGYPKKSYGGKYQPELTSEQKPERLIQYLKEKWSPEMMLPQLYKEYPPDPESPKKESIVPVLEPVELKLPVSESSESESSSEEGDELVRHPEDISEQHTSRFHSVDEKAVFEIKKHPILVGESRKDN